MAGHDIVIKKYMEDKERFSDLMNGSLFHGKQIVKEEHLKQIKGESSIHLMDKNEKRKSVIRYRDVVMKTDYVIFAIENQMNIHYAMPIRTMLYDALSYADQVEKIRKEHKRKGDKLSDDEFLSGMKKEDIIYPVITVVVYYGEKEWDASLDLYGMMEIGRKGLITEELKEALPNYKINLIHAGNIENPEKYKSSLQLVFGMLKYKADKTELMKYLGEHKKELSNIDRETYDVMGILLHMEKKLNDYRRKKGEKRDMCEAIKEMIEDGKMEGKMEGKNEGLIIGRIEATIEMCQEFQVSKEDTVTRIVEKFSIEEEEAKKFMEEYWK